MLKRLPDSPTWRGLEASCYGLVLEQQIPADDNGFGMIKVLENLNPLVFLIIATILEVSGDAIIRVAIYNNSGILRLVLMFSGAALLFGYGTFLNLAPLEFGQLVGLYIATLFTVWQIINYLAFRTLPTLPILLGGALIIGGGSIVTFWKPH